MTSLRASATAPTEATPWVTNLLAVNLTRP
jgi:hypothetical protein